MLTLKRANLIRDGTKVGLKLGLDFGIALRRYDLWLNALLVNETNPEVKFSINVKANQ